MLSNKIAINTKKNYTCIYIFIYITLKVKNDYVTGNYL